MVIWVFLFMGAGGVKERHLAMKMWIHLVKDLFSCYFSCIEFSLVLCWHSLQSICYCWKNISYRCHHSCFNFVSRSQRPTCVYPIKKDIADVGSTHQEANLLCAGADLAHQRAGWSGGARKVEGRI